MKLVDIIHKIAVFFKGKKVKKPDYSIKTVNVQLRDIPYSAYLVIKKYGWAVFFYKSVNYAKAFFKKYREKIKDLYEQVVLSFRKEGFEKMTLRVLNYIFYGKGVLIRKEIIKHRHKFKPKIYNINHIDALDIDTLGEIQFAEEKNPKVSIIIPIFNKWKITYDCLDSLKKNIEGIAYEVIIIDDGSIDETGIIMKRIKNVVYIKNQKNLGFVSSCNAGARKAKGEYIVFLNNDTSVKKNWLKALLETFQNNKNIGLVGSKLIYPDGRLQEAGGIIWKNKNAWNYGRYKNPDNPEFNYLKDVDYCSGASIMLPREVFERLGGFDEIFSPGYCEDSDLAFRVRQIGLRTVYQPQSELFHFEGITSGTDSGRGMKKYQEINKEKFSKRWRDVLEKENFNDDEGCQFPARDRSKNKKTVLVIDHYIPTFDKDAGSRTVYHYIKLLSQLRYNVKFIGDNFCKEEPYATALQQLGVEILYGQYYAKNWANWIKENSRYIDFVFVNRPHVAVKYFDVLKKYTNAKIIYYGHDLHFLRTKREYELTKNNNLLKESEMWKDIEFDIMKKVDVSLYPSQIEVDEINKRDADIKAQTLTAYMYGNERFEYDAKGRENLLFIGGFNHKPNIDAMLWFCKKIFPKVLIKNPNIELYIVGSDPTKEIFDLNSDNIVVRGFVGDEELAKIYSKVRLTIAPLRYGAGIKGKIIESMYNCVPVLTTSCGAEGIGNKDKMLIIADNNDEFADKLVLNYSNYDDLNSMSIRSKQFIDENYSIDSVIKRIKEIF